MRISHDKLARNLKVLRNATRLTAYNFGKLCNISESAIFSIESGKLDFLDNRRYNSIRYTLQEFSNSHKDYYTLKILINAVFYPYIIDDGIRSVILTRYIDSLTRNKKSFNEFKVLDSILELGILTANEIHLLLSLNIDLNNGDSYNEYYI